MVAPGLLFVLIEVPKFIAPPLCVNASLFLLSWAYSFQLPVAVIIAAWLFTTPLFIQVRSWLTRLARLRQARRLGAQLVPSVKGRLPGNIDILLSSFKKKRVYLGDGINTWIREYGTTFAITTLGETRVLTLDPQNIKKVLCTDFDNYVKGKTFNTTMEGVLGVGVFNSDGDLWQFHRKITRPFFAKERVHDFGIFDSKAHLAIQRMQERFDQGSAIDFQDICSKFTLDSACKFLLGASVDSLRSPLPVPGGKQSDELMLTASNHFARSFAKAQMVVSGRGRLGKFWRLKEFFKDETKEDMVVIRGFIDPIVKAAIQKQGQDNMSEKAQQTLLDHLVNVTDDMNLIVDEVLNIMLAGRDTTASLLTFVTYCLAMDPGILARLREEIISIVGSDRTPSVEDFREMKYLRAVINETLRLFSPVPFNVRQTIKGALLLNDDGNRLYIPPQTRVTFSFWNMHRHEAYWGPDAHLFDPDRWLDERLKKYVMPNPFIFLPFNAGPRICLGQQFAYHEASFFLVRMLQRFDHIELAPESQPPESRPPAQWAEDTTGSPRKKVEQCYPKAHLTLFVEGGLWLRMRTTT